MIFKRRDKPPFWQRMKEMVYPRKGWQRGIEYLSLRMRRLPDTPHRIALGVAIGVWVCFSPFYGFHMLFAALIAWAFGANILASLAGTFVGTPITFPLIAAACMGVGRQVTGVNHGRGDVKAVLDAFYETGESLWNSFKGLFGFGPGGHVDLSVFWWEIFVPYLIGGFIIGTVLAVASYFLAKPSVAAFQRSRSRKLKERHLKRHAKTETEADSDEENDYPEPKSER